MTGNPDLRKIEPPPEKHPTEYTYNERRAEIFRLWREASDPYSELSQTDLSKRYDMATSTIHDDFQVVKEYIRDNIGADEEVKTDVGFDRAIKKLEEQGKWYKAAQVRKSKWEWLHSTGIKEEAPDKTEITGEDGGALEINISHHRVSDEEDDSDED